MKNLCGQNVAGLRRRLGWSQGELQRRLGKFGLPISRPAIAKIETAKRCVSDFELVAFARVLEVTVSGLLRPCRLPRLKKVT
jgi:transcriptional regulator with XRE-family HTH domain